MHRAVSGDPTTGAFTSHSMPRFDKDDSHWRDPSIGRVVWSDLRRTDLTDSMGRDLRDLYRFFLDSETRARLETMGRVYRTFWLIGWLLKSLLLKLSPSRRFLLLLAMVLGILGWTSLTWRGVSVNFDFRPWGFLLLLFILMLELKDKLLARDEIQVARSVQQALLPREHPDLRGWDIWSYSVPANDVGGDLVDYIELGPERLGVVLGDVSGKGLGAALLSAKLQATLRALGPESPSLDDLGERMNTILVNDGLENRFATMFYAEIGSDSSHIRYLNAGHNPPYLLRRSGAVEELPPSSCPLGMLPGSRYDEGLVDIEPGEFLLVYSDGVTEAMNAGGEEFGEARVQALLAELGRLSPERAGKRLLQEIDLHLDGEHPQDDLSVVLIRKR
jgi:hypothetical protein